MPPTRPFMVPEYQLAGRQLRSFVLVLVLVLLLVLDIAFNFSVPDAVFSDAARRLSHLREHRNDSMQQLLAVLDFFWRLGVAPNQHVEYSGTLKC